MWVSGWLLEPFPRPPLQGWGVLFFERDHHVHVLHRTLFDWLQVRLG